MSCTAVDSVPERSTIFRLGRGHDVFHQGPRSVRLVLVDDRHPSPRMTGWLKTVVRTYERKQRHAEDQKQRHTIVKQPLALPARPAKIRVLTPASLRGRQSR